jgi:hypothetical protein
MGDHDALSFALKYQMAPLIKVDRELAGLSV